MKIDNTEQLIQAMMIDAQHRLSKAINHMTQAHTMLDISQNYEFAISALNDIKTASINKIIKN